MANRKLGVGSYCVVVTGPGMEEAFFNGPCVVIKAAVREEFDRSGCRCLGGVELAVVS